MRMTLFFAMTVDVDIIMVVMMVVVVTGVFSSDLVDVCC